MSTRRFLFFVFCLALVCMPVIGADSPSRPPGRTGLMAVAVGDQIFISGGFAVGVGSQSRLDAWNPKAHENSWQSLPALPTERSLGAMVELDHKLYLLGGIDSKNAPARNVDVFNLQTKEWETSLKSEALPSRTAAVVVNDEIYLVGGIDPTSSKAEDVCSKHVMSLNPKTNAWTRRADLKTGRHGHAAAVWNGKIYVSGGESATGGSTSVEVYDPATQKWSDAPLSSTVGSEAWNSRDLKSRPH